jgi:nicotinate-nucleotide adenylyltransferase
MGRAIRCNLLFVPHKKFPLLSLTQTPNIQIHLSSAALLWQVRHLFLITFQNNAFLKIGLFFGSFNPIHIGHLVIANFMATQTDLKQVWFVVSPHNPLKLKATLAKDSDRLNMVKIAIESNPLLRASDIEFKLPKPSFTIDTLAHLTEKYPQHTFVLIMGGDNLGTLDKWKNYAQILKNFQIYVYRRPNYDLGAFAEHENVHLFDAPLMDISATYIRKCLKEQLSVQYLLTPEVEKYLLEGKIY